MTSPLHVVVMGVSGTGKSVVGNEVAAELRTRLLEGDDYHPRSNIEKMSSGTPLDDDDRRPWLQRLAEVLARDHEAGNDSVLACSALRRTYRDILRGELPDGSVFFLHLHADYDVLENRMRSRAHFMPVSLLRSQFETLEPLEPDEHGIRVDVALPLDEVVGEARDSLAAYRG